MGAGKFDRVNKVLKTGLICSALTGGVLGVAATIFGHTLLGIYSSSEAVIAAGMERMKLIASMYAICGLMEGMGGVMRGMGYSVLPTVVTLLGVCVLRLAWISALLHIPALYSVATVYVSYPVSWAVTFAAHVACFLWVRKRAFGGLSTK